MPQLHGTWTFDPPLPEPPQRDSVQERAEHAARWWLSTTAKTWAMYPTARRDGVQLALDCATARFDNGTVPANEGMPMPEDVWALVQSALPAHMVLELDPPTRGGQVGRLRWKA